MTWHQIPFLRLLLPLLAGIVLQHYTAAVDFCGESLWLAATLLLLFSLAWGWLHKQRKNVIRFWALQHQLFWLFVGAAAAHWQDARQHPQHLAQMPALLGSDAQYLATIAEPTQLRNTSIRAVLTVQAMRLHDSAAWQPLRGNIIATLPADTFSAALRYGDEILLRTRLRPITGASNPNGLDLRTYYAARGIFHQTYIVAEHWVSTGRQQIAPLRAALYDLRSYLLATIAEHCPTRRERAILSALVLGVRDEVDGEMLSAFADVGAMHILSVSGMHVGLIAALLSWFLLRLPLPARRWWLITRALLLIALIWLFALLTGGSPPALRSAAMFSIVSVVGLSKRQGNIYNSLAASAFLLLLYEPYWLWDVGFQLSYLALWGIAFYQPPIRRMLYVENRLLRYVWELTSVSIAAALSTLPLTLFYFHQFSLSAFWSGIAAVPLSTVLLVMGFVLLIVGKVPIIGALLGWATYWLCWLFGAVVLWAQQVPYMVVRGIWINALSMWWLYLLLALLTLALRWRSARLLVASCAAFWLLLLGWTHSRWQQMHQRQFCIYQVYKGSTLAVIQGSAAATLGDSVGLSEVQLRRVQANHFSALGVDSTSTKAMCTDSALGRDFAYFSPLDQIATAGGTLVGCLSPALAECQSPTPLPVAAVLITGGLRYGQGREALQQHFRSPIVVLDGTHSMRNAALWRAHCDSLGLLCLSVAESGALLVQW